jgi:hypothetical protein
MRLIHMSLLAVLAAAFVAPALAQQLYVYPTKGQSADQQSRDESECHGWAAQQSGYNPYMSSGQTQPSGGILRGAAGGAALGAIGGAIAGDAGKGAAIGAATGGLFGGLRQHRQRQDQAYQSQQGNDAYLRALTACLQGRGYSVQ